MRLYALHDHDEDLQKRGCFQISKESAAQLNSEGYGIFFTPNSFINGERKKEKLKKLNFWFIDYDKGVKDDMLDMIEEFKSIPTMVVETHRGYHVYWKCSEDLVKSNRVDDYLDTLEKLVEHFDSDYRAQGETRILRVPNYEHCKDPLNKFLVRNIWECEASYTIDEINASIRNSAKIKELKPIYTQKELFLSSTPSRDEFWQNVADLDCFECLPMLSNQPECNNEVFHVERYAGKGKIYVNDELVSSCWIDVDGKIGSHNKGGPTLANWIMWYNHSWEDVAKCLKRCIPNLKDEIKLGSGFEW